MGMVSTTTWRIGMALAGATLALSACRDALRFEPPPSTNTLSSSSNSSGTGGEAGGAGGMTTGSTTGSGGGAAANCESNSDCPEPTSICDTYYGHCVECLLDEHCAFRPGTVCDLGLCACPDDAVYCGPNKCIDVATSPSNCGQCDHVCFGECLAGQCLDPWEPLGTKDAPQARTAHLAVWTGTEMIVWGGTSNGAASGALNSGGIYDPATYEWSATTIINAPAPRVEATVVWTGTEMIVWGGRDNEGNFLNNGGRFDPSSNSWKTLSPNAAPSPRSKHTAIWTGTQMVIWGGVDDNNQLVIGASYKPADDSWQPTGLITGTAAPRERHSAVWNGQLMLTYGGVGDTPQSTDVYLPNDGVPGGRSYDPVADSWGVVNQTGEPSPRADHSALFAKGRMLLFGGVGSAGYFSSGFKFENDKWVSFNGNAPSGRRDHTAIWLDGAKRMVVWGGRGDSGALDDGGVFDPLNNAWTKPLSSPLQARYDHTAIAAGEKMIIWGGAKNNGQPLADGALYTP